jgi:hypothetical protein
VANGEKTNTYDLVDTKDGTDINTSINVTRSIQRIKHDTAILSALFRNRWNHVLCAFTVTNDNSLVNFLADHDTTFPTSPQSIDHDIITQYIEFLLIFSLDIGSSGQSDKVDKSGFSDVGCNVFRCHLIVSCEQEENEDGPGWRQGAWLDHQ